jgi:phage gp45-like
MSNHKASTDPTLISIKGMIRRMIISTTTKVLWRLDGFKFPDGTTERSDVENFAGIGFYAKPPSNSKAEAIVVNVGGASSPAIVATRDEATRQAVAGNIAADETSVHNSKAVIHIKANGTVEIRSALGVALPLATLADLDALKAVFAACVIVPTDGGAAIKAAIAANWDPTGTTKLKGE